MNGEAHTVAISRSSDVESLNLAVTVGLHPRGRAPSVFQREDILAQGMRELLYDAAKHYRRGKGLAERGDINGALEAFESALQDLHAVRPQRMRDVLLAQVYLSRYQLARQRGGEDALDDLRRGYSYARTTMEPPVRRLAEDLWQEHLRGQRSRPEATGAES